MTSVVWKHRAD